MTKEIQNFCETTYRKMITGQGNENIKMDMAETGMVNKWNWWRMSPVISFDNKSVQFSECYQRISSSILLNIKLFLFDYLPQNKLAHLLHWLFNVPVWTVNTVKNLQSLNSREFLITFSMILLYGVSLDFSQLSYLKEWKALRDHCAVISLAFIFWTNCFSPHGINKITVETISSYFRHRSDKSIT
jgi:hypothetical protein